MTLLSLRVNSIRVNFFFCIERVESELRVFQPGVPLYAYVQKFLMWSHSKVNNYHPRPTYNQSKVPNPHSQVSSIPARPGPPPPHKKKKIIHSTVNHTWSLEQKLHCI